MPAFLIGFVGGATLAAAVITVILHRYLSGPRD